MPFPEGAAPAAAPPPAALCLVLCLAALGPPLLAAPAPAGADHPGRAIVWLRDGSGARKPARLAAERTGRVRYLRSGPYAVVPLPAGGVEELARDPAVRAVVEDRHVRGQLAATVALMGLDGLHAQGWTGAGVTVGVVDTGIDRDHPDLADAVAGERCFCAGGCCPDGSSDQSGPGSAEDDGRHGTNVAGVITANGIVAGPGGAPDAGIVAVKALDAAGGGFLSDVLLALEWILAEHPEVRAVNLSLATDVLYPGDCDEADAATAATAAVIRALNAAGIAVVAATGNHAATAAMPLPACVSHALSVAGVWSVAFGGPFDFGACIEPFTAPDRFFCLSDASATTDLVAPAGPMVTTDLGGGTRLVLATSFAAAAATSCAAVLLQAVPALSPARLEAALEGSPVRVPNERNGRTYPRVDCPAALAAARALAAPRPAPAAAPLALAILVAALLAAGLPRLSGPPG